MPDEPAGNDAIVAKFMDNAQSVMAPARAAEIRDRILGIEEERDARALSRLLGGR